MKFIIHIFLYLILVTGFSYRPLSANYYVSFSTGNDANPGTLASPWKTVAKVNAIQSTLIAGDSILFKRGDTWTGEQLVPNKNGTVSNRIIYAAYGSGAKPIITGFTIVTAWTSLGGNIYESTSAIPGNPAPVNMIAINDVYFPMGRYPNTNTTREGWLNIDKHLLHGARDTIIENAIPSATTNWAGARAIVHTSRYINDTITIEKHNGDTLFLSRPGYYGFLTGYGFFISNDSRTLDQHGEWYYNIATKKIRFYLSTAPSNYTIKVSNTNDLLQFSGDQYLTFDNLAFTGANDIAVQFTGTTSHHITFNACDWINTGNKVMETTSDDLQSKIVITNSYVNEVGNYGFDLRNAGDSLQVSNTVVKKVAYWPGTTGGSAQCCVAMGNNGNNVGHIYEDNIIDSSGWSAIRFNGSNVSVKRNFITNYCMTLDDGAAIYFGYVKNCCVAQSGIVIKDNILLDGWGNAIAVSNNSTLTAGVYSDDNGNGAEIANNTIRNATKGIYIHNSYNMNIHNNTTYACTSYGTYMLHDVVTSSKLLGIISKYNRNVIIAASGGSGGPWAFGPDISLAAAGNGTIDSIGTIDSNYYARPFNEGASIRVRAAGITANKTLAQFKALYVHDQHSGTSPITFALADSAAAVLFFYNPTASPVVKSLGAVTYVETNGITTYNSGTATVPAWSSLVLFKTPQPFVPPPTAGGRVLVTPAGFILVTPAGYVLIDTL